MTIEQLINKEWYSLEYGLAISEVVDHYLAEGWRLGYNPNPFFDAGYYREVTGLPTNMEPLTHFLENGDDTGKVLFPFFDRDGYRAFYPDVIPGTEIKHYMSEGYKEGRSPGYPIFDIFQQIVETEKLNFNWSRVLAFLGVASILEERSRWPGIIRTYRDLFDENLYARGAASGPTISTDRLKEYSVHGWILGKAPNEHFSPSWYTKAYGPLYIEPLFHYVVNARVRNIVPCVGFPSGYYDRSNRDVRKAGANLFAHWVKYGRSEGRSLGLPDALKPYLVSLGNNNSEESICAGFSVDLNDASVDFQKLKDGNYETALEESVFCADDAFVSYLSHLCRDGKILSLDVWDTIIRRRCHPDEIKLRAARALWLKAGSGLAPKVLPKDLYRIRQLAEGSISDLAFEYEHDHTVKLWLAYLSFDNRDTTIFKYLTEYEVNLEKKSTYADATIAAFLTHSRGRKIAVSDFYMSQNSIISILKNNGSADVFENIYVSSEFGKTKRTGDLYDQVLEELGAQTSEVIHIGDNYHADVVIPTDKGIKSIFYNSELYNKQRNYWEIAFHDLIEKSGYVHGARILNMLKSRGDEIVSFYERIGFDIAPIFIGFGLSIVEQAIQKKVETVYFFSREGLFFKKIYDLLAEADVYDLGAYPKSKMLDVSRRATFAPSLRSFSIPELMRLWSQYSEQSLFGFCQSLNLDLDLLIEVASKVGLNPYEKIKKPWKNPSFLRVISHPEVAEHATKRIEEQRTELMTYLAEAQFPIHGQEECVVVDIGWRGSIQDNLAHLMDGHIHGIYLGLFRYLNNQPLNSSKYGFLVDANLGEEFELGEVAALELLSNCRGGSVIGYKDGKPIKEIIEGEDCTLENVESIQRGVEKAADICSTYIQRHGLTSNDVRSPARFVYSKLRKSPPPLLADAFVELVHNETFGSGEADDLSRWEEMLNTDIDGCSSRLYDHLCRIGENVRWSEALFSSTKFKKYVESLPLSKQLATPRKYCKYFALSAGPTRPMVSIFVPPAIRGSGGHRTIFNYAKGLERAGFDMHVFLENDNEARSWVEEEFYGTSVRIHSAWFSGIQPDIAVATVAHSASYVRDFFGPSTKKLYFVQDYEAAFNPVSDGYVRGQNSYTAPLLPICIGKWLPNVLSKEYGIKAVTAGLGVDTNIYYLDPKLSRMNAITVLYQPEKWRRLPELTLETLLLVKSKLPSIKIFIYGSNKRPELPFQYDFLGLVDDLTVLNRLYNETIAGLCISATNPSRIPFEMMAAGCVPVDLYRYNNFFDYPAGTAKLAFQSPESVARALLELVNGEADGRRAACLDAARPRSLEWEIDTAVNATIAAFHGEDFSRLDLSPAVMHQPVIASEDLGERVIAFCKSQLNKATCDTNGAAGWGTPLREFF